MKFDLLNELGGIDGARDLQMQGPLQDRPTNIAAPGEHDDYNPIVDSPDKHKEEMKLIIDETDAALNKLLVFLQVKDETQPQFGQLETAVNGVLDLLDGISPDAIKPNAPVDMANKGNVDIGAGSVGQY